MRQLPNATQNARLVVLGLHLGSHTVICLCPRQASTAKREGKSVLFTKGKVVLSPTPSDQIKRTHFHFKPGMGYWLGLFIMSVYEGLVYNPLSPSGNVIVCMCLILKSLCFFKYYSVIRPKLFRKAAESEVTRSRKQRLREDGDSSPTSLGPFRAQEPIM